MLINKDEIARKVLSGEITSKKDLNGVLRSIIKDVVEMAMGVADDNVQNFSHIEWPNRLASSSVGFDKSFHVDIPLQPLLFP